MAAPVSLHWANLNPSSAPATRDSAAMAFDPCSGQLILFGGFNGSFLGDTWAFDANTNTWTNLNPAGSTPPVRDGASMAFDPCSGQLILFGGFNGSFLGDTWAFDANINTWTNLNPAGSTPPARDSASMAFDSCSGQLILFGGFNGSFLNDTWAFDAKTNTWAQLTPTSSPSVRANAAMAFDPCSGQLILFGGDNTTGSLGDTWAFNANTTSPTWINLNPAGSTPSARDSASMDFDPCTGQLILFGGENVNGINVIFLGDTWAFDAKTNTWTDLNLSGTIPSPRALASMSFDFCSGQMILFGGRDLNTLFNDTWALEIPTNSILLWENLNPSSPPTGRQFASMAFDPCSGQLILFGGYDGFNYFNDTWAFDANTNTWTNLNPSSAPPSRFVASMAFDPCSGQIILFAGLNPILSLNDTWAFDAQTNTWTNLNPSSAPSVRYGAAMAFDPCSGQIILFGGLDEANNFLNDTWAFDANTNTWTNLDPSSVPPVRFAASMAFDPRIGQIILFGGLNRGFLNDTWAFDAQTNTWTNLNPSSAPSIRYGATMAFDPCSGQIILFGGSNGPLNDTWALQIFASPLITSPNAVTFVIGIPSSFTVTTTGFPTPSITEMGILPPGITFVDNGNGTATLSGTPLPGTTGIYPLMFTAANGILPNAIQNFTLAIAQSPAITSANAVTFVVGTPSSFTVTTTGFPTPSITKIGILPSGITFVDNGNGTATLSGTPIAGSVGIYPLMFTAANGILPNAVQNFTLTIAQPPVITSTNAVTFVVGTSSNFTVTTTGFPTPSITEMGILPPGITFVDNGNGTATLSGTPLPGTTGIYPLMFTAANGILPNAIQNFTLTIITTTTTTATILQAFPNPSPFGQPLNLTAIVAPSSATGTVTFFDGSSILGIAPLMNGTAILTASSLAIGTHTLFAVYNGDLTHFPSTSAGIVISI